MKRHGFTFVEILVTITIIGIVAGMTVGALFVVRGYALTQATKGTIVKLDEIVQAKMESFRTRKLPLSDDGMKWVATHKLGWQGEEKDKWRVAWQQKVRIVAMRDLMRMEMPERLSDIQTAPIYFSPTTWGLDGTRVKGPGAYETCRRALLDSAGQPKHPSTSSAELLYLIVRTSGYEYSARQFNAVEVSKPINACPFFLDAWGHPILFLRWPAGFTDSDLQTNDPATDHDTFDPTHYDAAAYRLVPLVYSPGPDGIPGLAVDYAPPEAAYVWASYGDHYAAQWGALMDGAYDNIHNHRRDMR